MDFPTPESPITDQSYVMSEEDDIQRAIQMSLEKTKDKGPDSKGKLFGLGIVIGTICTFKLLGSSEVLKMD